MALNLNLLHMRLNQIAKDKGDSNAFIRESHILSKSKPSIEMSVTEALGISVQTQTEAVQDITEESPTIRISAQAEEDDVHSDAEYSVNSTFLHPFRDKRWWRRKSSQSEGVKDISKVIFNFYTPPTSAAVRESRSSKEGSGYESFPPPQPRRGSFGQAIVNLISSSSSVSDKSNSLLREECTIIESESSSLRREIA